MDAIPAICTLTRFSIRASRLPVSVVQPSSSIFFFNDTATTEIYTLSLHDALPICVLAGAHARADDPGLHAADRSEEILRRDRVKVVVFAARRKDGDDGLRPPLPHDVHGRLGGDDHLDRKSTRLNSSHT